MKSIVVAIRDKYAQRQIREDLESESRLRKARIEVPGDYNSLMKLLLGGEKIDLLVIDYDFAWVSDPANGDEVSQAITLAESFADGKDTLTLILGPITRSDDEYKLTKLDKVKVISVSSMFELVGEQGQPLHVATILAMLENQQISRNEAGDSKAGAESPAGVEPQKPTGLLELRIDPKDMVTFSARLIYSEKETLNLPTKNFRFDVKQKKLLEYFETVLEDKKVSTKTFLGTLKQVGQTTRDILNYDDATKFSVMKLLGETGGVDNIWIRFSISNKDMAPIPFESILRCDQYDDQARKPEFQLNYSPVYRVVGNQVPRDGKPRFPGLSGLHKNDSERFRCLLIDASTSGPILKGDHEELPDYLPEIEDEAKIEIDLVEALFKEAEASDAIENAQLLKLVGNEQLPGPEQVLDGVFEDCVWDIIHFSGHSIYLRGDKGQDDQGFIFLPGELGAIPVPIEKVASLFKRAQLVYMSSCQSADPGFVNTLADMGIPMIIGFRWQVSSLGASQFAGLFYRYLFQDRTGDIESAFVRAQRSMINKKKYPLPEELTDKERYPITVKSGRKDIWEKPDVRAGVSPLLIMQNV